MRRLIIAIVLIVPAFALGQRVPVAQPDPQIKQVKRWIMDDAEFRGGIAFSTDDPAIEDHIFYTGDGVMTVKLDRRKDTIQVTISGFAVDHLGLPFDFGIFAEGSLK